jgi:hypothetical protein
MRIISPCTFVAVAIVGTDAFSPTFRVASRSRIGGGGLRMASDRPLTELCEITKEACEAVAPMLNGKSIYTRQNPMCEVIKPQKLCSCCPSHLVALLDPYYTELYSQIKIGTGTSDTAAFKSDATFFTIADGIVQHMFIEYLFAGDKFGNIVGEEDDSVVNILEVRLYYVIYSARINILTSLRFLSIVRSNRHRTLWTPSWFRRSSRNSYARRWKR